MQLIRIKKAQELLENTNLPINKIAKSVGYISNSHFTSYFKKYVGVTPVEYRKTFVENTELRKITT
ncbi:helix-turn-helix domain-containing protein [Brevibacillus gelatini]